MTEQQEQETFLTPAEVAAIFRVNPKTVSRWAIDGKLKAIKTIGGQRRYYKSEIDSHLQASEPRPTSSEDDPDVT